MDRIVFRNMWCSLIKNNKNKYTFLFFYHFLHVCEDFFMFGASKIVIIL